MLDGLLSLDGPGKFEGNCGASSGGGEVLLLQDEPRESGCDCEALLGEVGGDAFLYLGGPGESGGNCKVLSGGSGGDTFLSLGRLGASGCDCEALSESRRSVLATDILSCLSSGLASGVASAPSRVHRASRHGASLRNSLAVRCWPWEEQLVLGLVLALKSFGIIV